jgi:ribosome-associated protein
MLVVNDKIAIPLREFQFTYSRSSGPGGQNVNKVSTKVQLHWDLSKTASLPPDVLARLRRRYKSRITSDDRLFLGSQRFRDQGRNVADVLSKLAEMIRTVSSAPVARRRTRVSAGQKQRRLENKRRHAEKKRNRKLPE